MKGVVRPQARPTRRKPRVQLRIEGEGGGVVGEEGEEEEEEDIVELGGFVWEVEAVEEGEEEMIWGVGIRWLCWGGFVV